MALNLNEYCLHHIIQFLEPRDWIQTSRVCKLWKLATSKYWKSITKIEYLGYYEKHVFKDAEIVSAKDLEKMVFFAAPFVNVLRSSKPSEESHYSNYVRIGHYRYKVENFKIDNVLKLLAKRSTKLTEVYFDYYPLVTNLVGALFEKNNITKFKVYDCRYGWYLEIPTQQIEELDLNFDDILAVSESYKGRFPKLRKLNLEIKYKLFSEDPKNMLLQILPHVLGLKSLNLTIYPNDNEYTVDLFRLLLEVTKLTELEELSVYVTGYEDMENTELFFDKLSKCCPKLRVLKITGLIYLEDESLQPLLTLPQLESFEFQIINGFPDIKLPELKHLTELNLTMLDNEPYLTGLFEAIKSMPRLEKLVIDFRISWETEDSVMIDLVCGVSKVVTSLGKDVLVGGGSYTTHIDKLMITKSTNHEAAEMAHKRGKIFELKLNYEKEKPLFEGVAAFVRNQLYRYNTIILEKANVKKGFS